MKLIYFVLINLMVWNKAFSVSPSTCQISMMQHNLLEPKNSKYDLPPKNHNTYQERIQYHYNRGVLREYGPSITSQRKPEKHPCVVLTHGFAESSAAMKKVAQKYYDAGFNVINTLLPGHGHSKKDMVQSIIRMQETFLSWENEIKLALKSAKEIGNGKVVLHGFSMGGTVGVKVIQGSPELVDAAVVSSPMIERSSLMEKAMIYVRKQLQKWLESDSQKSIDGFSERDLGNYKERVTGSYFAKGIGYASRPIESDDFILAFQHYILENNAYYFKKSPHIYVAYSEYDRISAPDKIKLFFNGDNIHINTFKEKQEIKHDDLLRGDAAARLTHDQINWAANHIGWKH